MRSSRRNRSNSENMSHRRGVDQAKAARAKAAIRAAKSQSPKSVYKSRKLKAAIDLETPKSLLVNIRLKSIINLDTYKLLSREEKERLVLLLPPCDQQKDRNGIPILNSEALNNEFFAKACVEWSERLGEGEFLKDRQQGGDASWKVRPFGPLNGAKSHVIESLSTDTKASQSSGTSASSDIPLLHLTRLRNASGSCISAKLTSDRYSTLVPKRCRRRAINLRLQQVALDDGASVLSETSSESSLSVCSEQSRVRLSCTGYGVNRNSLAPPRNHTGSRMTHREASINHGLGFFVHPALQDHDYVLPFRPSCAPTGSEAGCESRTSQVPTVRRRYRRRRGRNRRWVRSKKCNSVGVRLSSIPASAVGGFREPMEPSAESIGGSLKTDAVAALNDVLHVNGIKADSQDSVSNSEVLLSQNSLLSNPSAKTNGRLNGSCSPNVSYLGHSVSVEHLTNVATDKNSWLKENDVNLNYVARPPRLKSVPHLRKCEQTDGMPLIQIQGSDLLSRLGCTKCDSDPSVRDLCNKDCRVVPSSVCFGRNEPKSNACDDDDSTSPASDAQGTRTGSDVDGLSPGRSKSVSPFDLVRSTSFEAPDCRNKSDEKFFVRLIGIQKIPLCSRSADHDAIRSGELDSSPDPTASVDLPPSVLQEVQRCIQSGGSFPHVGHHYSGSSSHSGKQLVVGHPVEISSPSNAIRSQEDLVACVSPRQTDAREHSLLHRDTQNFKLIGGAMNRRPNGSSLDTSDCVWEAIVHQKDTAVHGH